MLIKNLIQFILVILLPISFAQAATNRHTLNYEIEYTDKNSPHLTINSSFISENSQRTLIHLPQEGIKDLRAIVDNLPAKIIPNAKDITHQTAYILHARKKAKIQLHYNLVQTFPQSPTAAALWHALINADYFYFIGYQALIWPDPMNKDVDLNIAWKLPAYKNFYNSFGTTQTGQHASVANIHDLENSLFVGGDFRLAKNIDENKNQIIFTAIRGTWPFADQHYASELSKTFTAVNTFWPSDHPKEFLNVLIPVQPLHSAREKHQPNIEIGGSELFNAFVLMATTPSSVSKKDWEIIHSMAAHEYNHHWVPLRLATLATTDLGGRWFSEGFNEYLAQKFRLNAGNITFENYLTRCNEVLRYYFTSPAFDAEIDVGQYPDLSMETVYFILQSYYRGEILAWRWNLKSASHHAVETAVLKILHDAPKGPIPFSDAVVAKYLTDAGVSDALADIKLYARGGTEIPLTGEEFAGFSEKVFTKKIPMNRYEIGFDLQKSKQAKKIIGLQSNGPAAKAGIRNGMDFIDLTYVYGDSRVAVKITLAQHEVISYLPIKPIEVLQYYLQK